jgi:hypothetical protein
MRSKTCLFRKPRGMPILQQAVRKGWLHHKIKARLKTAVAESDKNSNFLPRKRRGQL